VLDLLPPRPGVTHAMQQVRTAPPPGTTIRRRRRALSHLRPTAHLHLLKMRTTSPRPVRNTRRTHLQEVLQQSQDHVGMRIMRSHPAPTKRQHPRPALVRHLPRHHDDNLFRDTLTTLEVHLRILPTTAGSSPPLASGTYLHLVLGQGEDVPLTVPGIGCRGSNRVPGV
jgi:hypothetical protein